MAITSRPDALSPVLRELIEFIRKNSDFYRDLWAKVPDDASSLEVLPAIAHHDFWASNTSTIDTNRLITGSITDGGIFRTGGTTSEPKVSFYTRDELHVITRQVGDCLVRAGLLPGDRVANLFYSGELYMGFLLQVLAWLDSTTPYVQLPIGGGVVSLETTVTPMREFKATVAVAMPTTLVSIADYLSARGEQLPHVRLLIYAGESLYEDQRALLARSFPNATARPLMYGSVDGGLMAVPTHDAELASRIGGPVYAPNSPNVIIEILGEDGPPIVEAGVKGLVHVTHLTRRLMPIIRYPTGDVAEWVDPKEKLFVLRGRDLVGFRIGPSSYVVKDLRSMVAETLGVNNLQGFQIAARRRDAKDELVFRIAAVGVEDKDLMSENLENALRRESKEYAFDTVSGYIGRLVVEWVGVQDLLRNPRTGKLRDTIEERY